MAYIDGDDFIDGAILSFQQANRMKDNFRLATPPANIQPGMLFSDSDDDKLYHEGAAGGNEILQSGVILGSNIQLGDDVQIIFGDDSDASIQYDETIDDLMKLGVPVSNNVLAILQQADIGQDLVSVPAYGHPTIALYGASFTDYLAMYHDETDGYFRTLDGSFIFQTDEGVNTPTSVFIKPKGSSEISELGLFDTDGQRLQMITAADRIYMRSLGGALGINDDAAQPVYMFESAGAGENPVKRIYGYITAGAAARYQYWQSEDVNDEAIWGAENNANLLGLTAKLNNAAQSFRVRDSGGVVKFQVNGTGIGLFATAPAAQPAAITDATGAGDVVDRLNSLLAAMRTLGIIAT